MPDIETLFGVPVHKQQPQSWSRETGVPVQQLWLQDPMCAQGFEAQPRSQSGKRAAHFREHTTVTPPLGNFQLWRLLVTSAPKTASVL